MTGLSPEETMHDSKSDTNLIQQATADQISKCFAWWSTTDTALNGPSWWRE